MIYELREYLAAPGRGDALHRRFAQSTFPLFDRHGLEVTGFWTDREDPDRIVYLLRFPDEETRRQCWAGFQEDPDWREVRSATEADGAIVAEMSSTILTRPAYWGHETVRESP
ncbi:NIPSNAP family protein [Streptomyces canus]|uniref:NIPSNAP family protein n=1 Tax=Streptomyces canus TaxID=58343 RepID=UPI002E30F213|nr:NIPSNAP family protein [Streptomyces canus]